MNDTAYHDPDDANDWLEESRLPPTQAADAATYLRAIFKIVNDPSVTGQARTSEYHVPPNLRGFVTEYMHGKGYAIRYFNGPLTGKSYLTVAPRGDQ